MYSKFLNKPFLTFTNESRNFQAKYDSSISTYERLLTFSVIYNYYMYGIISLIKCHFPFHKNLKVIILLSYSPVSYVTIAKQINQILDELNKNKVFYLARMSFLIK